MRERPSAWSRGRSAPLALAGIMGGASSEVGDATRVVALEAAAWEPRAIRRAARALGMHTEASHRFERAADPEGPTLALARFAHLLEQTGGGTSRPGLLERHPVPRPRTRVLLRTARLEALLGTKVEESRTREILEGLGFSVGPATAGEAEVLAPTWRADVSREVDLIEEVGRHHGLGRIDASLPPSAEPQGLTESQRRARAVRDTLCAAGFTEVINYAFGPAVTPGIESRARRGLSRTPSPRSRPVLRPSLLPGLLENLRTNLRQGRRQVAIFETGRVFAPGPDLPKEERHLAILLAGEGRPAHWSERARPADVFDLKGVLELLLRRLAIGEADLASVVGLPSYLHPGQGAAIRVGGDLVGSYGLLHPDTRAAADLREDVLVAELRLDALLEQPALPVRVAPLDRFPAMSRDLSILCDARQSAAALLAIIREAGGSSLRSVTFVDRYDRPPVPPGRMSLTVGLQFQDRNRTLTGEEVQATVESVVRGLRAAGAEIRSE